MLLHLPCINTADNTPFSYTQGMIPSLLLINRDMKAEQSNYICPSIFFLLTLSDNELCITLDFCKTNQRDSSVRTENGRRKSALKSTCKSSLHCQLGAHFEIKERSHKN